MVMDSIVASSVAGLNGYTALTLAGADDRYQIPVAGALGARFPTQGYVERAIYRTARPSSRARIRLATTQPQTMPCTMRACHSDILADNAPYRGELTAPSIGIPVPKDETLAIDADNANTAGHDSVVLMIRRDQPGIVPLKVYERVTRQNATITAPNLWAANTWTPAAAMTWEGILEQNKLYHLLGAAICDPTQQQLLIAARFRQIETAIGGKQDPRPTILGSQGEMSMNIIRFPEVIAFPGSAPPSIELVDDTVQGQAGLTYRIEMLIGEVGVLSPGAMQQQALRAQQQNGVPWQ